MNNNNSNISSALPPDQITNVHETNNFDIVVIGSGIGGLTAAALLARAGKSVLVIEQHDRPGGYAHAFKRKRYIFDSGVHITSGCGLGGYPGGQVMRRVLQAVKVYDELQFIPVNPFAHAGYPGITIDLPVTGNAFIETLSNLFPDQKQGLSDLLELCYQIAIEAARADTLMVTQDSALIQEQLSTLLKYRQATLAEVWNKYIQDPQLQSIFATHWPYLGLPPSKVSFVYWAAMLISYLEDGAYYCKGGFQKLADALVKGLINHGGKIRYKSAVTKIRIADNQVQSVLLATGEEIHAPTIITNADARQTIYKMIGESYFPKRYIARLNRMQASLSIFAVYIATDLDLRKLGAHHEAFYYNNFDHEANYLNAFNGDLTWLSVTIPTLVDPSLAPIGNHIVMLTTMISYDAVHWPTAKAEFLEKTLNFANQKLPGLKEHSLLIEAGSPMTLERYTSNFKGAAYGWDMTPEQTGANRLTNRSPIAGLFFAGHWTAPGGGLYGVSFSGMQTAQQILGINGQQAFWQQFEEVTD